SVDQPSEERYSLERDVVVRKTAVVEGLRRLLRAALCFTATLLVPTAAAATATLVIPAATALAATFATAAALVVAAATAALATLATAAEHLHLVGDDVCAVALDAV